MKLKEYIVIADELVAEIKYGRLRKDEIIQVLRDSIPIDGNYHPVIDWYYHEGRMKELLTPEFGDTKEDLQQKESIKADYEKDKPLLETIEVGVLLSEIYSYINVYDNKDMM